MSVVADWVHIAGMGEAGCKLVRRRGPMLSYWTRAIEGHLVSVAGPACVSGVCA